MKPYILVVDDEPDICTSVRDILEDEGYTVAVAENGEAARQLVREKLPDMVLLDIWMPDIDGISLLKEFSNELEMSAPVIMMSGHGNVETAVEATRLGARDFIEKPLSLARLLHTVEHTLAEKKQHTPGSTQRSPGAAVPPVGKTVQMQLLREQLEKLAQHNDTVLLRGEPGSGKTFCAKYIHARSARHQGPFMDVHTRQFHDGQGDVLLFGRENNGDTQPGLLEHAQGGTLFLDDVAELDMELQQSLYGVLSTGHWVRINGGRTLSLDARIITATRYDLEQEVRAGRFREDLYHLLNVVPVQVPALREHVEDVIELLTYYVNLLVEKEGLPYRNFTVAAQNRLRHYAWPGNIRELEGLVRRLLVLGLDTDIELDEVEAALEAGTTAAGSMDPSTFDLPLRQAREQFEKTYLEYHLRQVGGSVGKLAKLVGMERTNLYRKLRALGIDTRKAGR
ncbi:MAG TPA: sigma-54-dependent Fis family transcriptional regulator [Gammaproteobacteria bacterium]|nr:sigma-54-dependent Fis family transcriptional regulator [Gammaproteobacteria bacterium]